MIHKTEIKLKDDPSIEDVKCFLNQHFHHLNYWDLFGPNKNWDLLSKQLEVAFSETSHNEQKN